MKANKKVDYNYYIQSLVGLNGTHILSPEDRSHLLFTKTINKRTITKKTFKLILENT